MARLVSENEKRAKKEAAERARRRQALEARGYSADDANEVIKSIEEARLLAHSAAIGRGIGCVETDVRETEKLAVEAVRRAAAIIAKQEPARAARLRPVLAEIEKTLEIAKTVPGRLS